ncbi:hypothetical protein Cni_G08157 [Canna indica]|uniref:PHD-type domain-containing protein n=1 Tax=Canna indica TaxID=4628 RepID=A0AAQ3Q7N3_9LILI|nr:hypothetical protein Cni_G08157 [Canna indica]
MSSVGKERGAVRKGGRNGFSSSKKVDDSSKEKKRRLILSDSDSDNDDRLVSSQKVDRGTALNGDRSSLDDDNGVEQIKKEEEVVVERNGKRVLRSDGVKYSEGHVVSENKEVIGGELVGKRSREPADSEVSVKKFKMEVSEKVGKKKSQTGGYNSKTKFPQDIMKEMNADTDGDSKESDGVMENRTQTISHKAGKMVAENVKVMESPGNRNLRVRDSCSRDSPDRRDVSGISRCKDDAVRVQGKSGVFRVLPSTKKADELENHISKSNDKERSKELSSGRVATRSALKQPSFSPDKIVHGKSSYQATLSKNESRKSKVGKEEESRSNEPKIVSPETEKKRADMPKSKTGSKIKNSSSSNTVSTEKRKSNSTSGLRTEKQKLRDQLKNILLNAGWTIDLRPRKGRNYEDSVYIPPEGQGGYWSITKAYAVYQEQLSITCNAQGKNSSGRSSRTSSGSDSIIPLESLSILKRIVVNKRRRRKEDSDEAEGGRMKKIKKTSERRHPRNKETEDKSDEIRSRKKSNSVLASNSKTSLGRNKERGCALLARGSNHEAEAEDNDYVPYVGKRTVLSWMIDMGVLPINGKVKYMNQRKTKTKLEGRITRDGINCSCCSKILTMSKFELHAGSKILEPLQNIVLEERGVSLLECQLEAWKKQDESERQGFYNVDVSGDDPNDDTCGICGDGGDLICCDGCPSTFHLSCLGMEKLPPGDWHCTNCCCRYCGGISADTTQKRDGTISSLLSCHQCEAKYHQDCVPESESVSAISIPDISFCSQSCRKVFKRLRKILGTKNDLESGFSWRVVRRFDEDASKSPLSSHLMIQCNSKIAVALAVMEECFLPVVDQRSGIHLIHNVMYNCGSNFSRLNYSGFYSFILERGDEIISVASIRIHGTRLAEMPFIGTRNMYRRQGMCRRLLVGIESALCSLNVEKLVIPAISELKDTWTNVFGFKPLEVSQELEVRSINVLVFPGTGLLQKPLSKVHSSKEYKPVDGVGMVEHDIKHQHQARSTHEYSEPSTVDPELDTSVQAVVDCINKEGEGPSVSSIKISCGSADSPQSKCKSPELKALENAGEMSTDNFPEGVLTGSLDEDKPPVDCSTDQKAQLTSKLTLSNKHKMKNMEANTSSDLQECDYVSKQMSPNGFAPKQQVKKNGEPPVCSLGSTSTSEMIKTHSPNLAESNGQVSPASNHDANLDEKPSIVNAEAAALHPNSSSTHEGSEPFAFEIVSRCINACAGNGSGGEVHNSDKSSRFSLQQSIVGAVHVTNCTCGSILSHAKSCKIPGETKHSDMTDSKMIDAENCNVQPELATVVVTGKVLTKSRHVYNDVANGTNNRKDNGSLVEPTLDFGSCAVCDASVDIRKLDAGSESCQ